MSQIKIHISAILNRWDVKCGHSPLARFAKSIYPEVSDTTLKYIDEHCFYYHIKKGRLLLRSGETCEYLFLVMKGAFRGYIKEGNKELTTWITLENEMITSIRGLYSQQPYLENIQALEDSELIGATIKDLHFLYQHKPDMNTVGRKLLEKYIIDAEERNDIIRLKDVTARYNYFIEKRKDIADRIPLTYIASYLGMTLETLSRIRSKLIDAPKKRKK